MKHITVVNDFTDECSVYFGCDIVVDGRSYHVIFGHHDRGGYICIPSHNVSCEASDYDRSAGYNFDHLIEAGLTENAAHAIALYIDHYFEQTKISNV